MNLFQHNEELLNQPLAHRMRPRVLDEYIGQEHIIGKGRLLRRAIQKDQLSSIILYGPPGTGKTTLARVIANTTKSHFSTINAVLSGVKELRYEIEEAKNRLDHYSKRTILFIDEVHRWNKSQQDALLPHVENGTCILIGATTENPYFEVNPALVSRSRIFQLLTLKDEDLEKIAYQAINDKERGYGKWHIEFEQGALEHLVSVAQGDARSLLNALELAIETDEESGEQSSVTRYITKEIAEESIQQKAVLYDKEGDYHFDTISAFIKSIRGSDPDAALYWLAKMVVAGENPSFIFRRLLISATEDIGLADPFAISVILADAQAFDRIGLPEGRFHLSHATIYAATAPKSNSTMAFFDAIKSVEVEKTKDVPNHLKDPSRDSKGFGHGSGYLYPHAYKDHWVAQQYLPSSMQGNVFYHPSSIGYEGKMNETILKRREAQNEVPLDELHVEHYSSSFDDKTRNKWVQRALNQLGDSFEAIREKISNTALIKRHDTILITN
ncbi:MAG: AAA family ATPase, partial [Spirochaetia bacterium]|nr:AAA family ATPase [Spirochaetia bacterium]